MIFDLKTKIIGALLLTIAAMATYIHFDHKKVAAQTPESQQWHVAPVSPGVVATTEPVHPKQVNALPAKAKEQLKLPKDVQENPNIVVIGDTTLPPNDDPQSIALTLDMSTGDTQILAKEEPAPWFSVQHRTYLEVDYGYTLNNWQKTGQLSIAHDFLRVKDITLVGTAAVNNFGVGTVLVGLRYGF